jgi:hypothetical protein
LDLLSWAAINAVAIKASVGINILALLILFDVLFVSDSIGIPVWPFLFC